MKKAKIIMLAMLIAGSCAALVGCGKSKLTADEVAAKIEEANAGDKIFEQYGSVITTSSATYDGETTESTTYVSNNVYYYECGDAFSYMDTISCISSDPDAGPCYGCIIDMDQYDTILSSYKTIHWFTADGYEMELKDNNVIEMTNGDSIMDYTYDPETFLITGYAYALANDDSMKTVFTYEYNKDADDEKYIELSDEKWSGVVDTSNYINVTIKTLDGEESYFTVPTGCAINAYTSGSGYLHNDATDEDYYGEPLTEDTTFTELEF